MNKSVSWVRKIINIWNLIFLNSWLLKAHVESPLSGSIILAAITMAALNLANSWKHHVAVWEYTWSIRRKLCALWESCLIYIFWVNIMLNFRYIGLSFTDLAPQLIPSGLINIKLHRIFRDHTLEVIYTNTNNSENKNQDEDVLNAYRNKNLGSYLAGLIVTSHHSRNKSTGAHKSTECRALVVWGTNLPSSVGENRLTKQERQMFSFPPYQRSVIVGFILSDGWLTFNIRSKNARLGFAQSGANSVFDPQFINQNLIHILVCSLNFYYILI